jgi:Ran GTPase-activating protein (RanGAP) involved in mRNA processing and transport
VLPSRLNEDLEHKQFTNGKDDRPAVAVLYRKGFEERFVAVEWLSYYHLSWGDAEAKAVAAVLAAGAAPKLEKLYLAGNSIGDEGARALAGALPSATALKVLNLESNSIGDEGARALVEALPSAMVLERLCLLFNKIGNERARTLAGALQNATVLKDLYLSGNLIGDGGARALAEALPSAKEVRVRLLGLENNSIGDEAKAELRRACDGRSPKIYLYL